MINKITVTNDYGESIVLDMFDPWSSGLAIRSIDGLGPVNANVNMTDYASKDGGIFNGSRQSTRNIVFDLVFIDSKETIEQVRHRTYRYFPVKRKIKIKVETDTRTLETDGYVESNEPAIWAEDFEGCQVSVICESPYLTSPNKVISKLASIVDSFHFPFSSLEEPELTFGYFNVDHMVEVNNTGDVPTGLIFEIMAFQSITNPIIYNYRTAEWFGLTVTMEAGDIIEINTEVGNKTVKLLREGVETNYINKIRSTYNNTSLTWLQLETGSQAFMLLYDEEGEFDPNKATMVVKHNNRYLGV